MVLKRQFTFSVWHLILPGHYDGNKQKSRIHAGAVPLLHILLSPPSALQHHLQLILFLQSTTCDLTSLPQLSELLPAGSRFQQQQQTTHTQKKLLKPTVSERLNMAEKKVKTQQKISLILKRKVGMLRIVLIYATISCFTASALNIRTLHVSYTVYRHATVGLYTSWHMDR